jgi:hypothetical protein
MDPQAFCDMNCKTFQVGRLFLQLLRDPLLKFAIMCFRRWQKPQMLTTIISYERPTRRTRRLFNTSGFVGNAASYLLHMLTMGKEMLNHRGYIYTAKHEGWYSVSDETFYPPTQVQNSLDPSTGRKRMVFGPRSRMLSDVQSLTMPGFS